MDRHAVESLPHRARASYTLERGVWTATCRVCGYTTRDVSRGRAAAAFLVHIRAGRQRMREAGPLGAGWTAESVHVVDGPVDRAKLVTPPDETAPTPIDKPYQAPTRGALADSEG